MTDIKAWGRMVFDKIILFAVLFGLLLSLILLIVMVDRERKKLEDVSRKQEQSRTLAKPARLLDMAFLDDAIEELEAPLQIPAWSNRMMVAELRVSCVKCGRPIPIDAAACPFRNCGAQQPTAGEGPIKDSDLDGMPDEWELKHKLNLNVDDSMQDEDNDGFTNLEEYRAGTNPRDASSHPDYVIKLRVVQIGRTPMPISFQGVQRLSADNIQFLLVNRQLQRSSFAKLGDTVYGYKLETFEPKKRKVSHVTFETEEDISVLTVSKDNKMIPLTINQVNQGEIAAVLMFLVDQSKMTVNMDSVIPLKNKSYKVVDIKKDSVILADVNTGVKTTVEPFSESEKQLYLGVRLAKPDSAPDVKP